MIEFLKKIVDGNKFELLIDTKIFPKDIILKAAYNFLDLGYFFFKIDENKNIILQFTSKEGIEVKPETIIGNFTDELLNVYLRDKLEKDNKEIRESIITSAIASSIDVNNFVSIDTDNKGNNQIDFDKDIEEILKEIENDPDLKIDEEEIERILREIEEESKIEEEQEKIKPVLDPKKAKDAKKKFQNGK